MEHDTFKTLFETVSGLYFITTNIVGQIKQITREEAKKLISNIKHDI